MDRISDPEVHEVFGCENDCGFRSFSYTAVLQHEATCRYVAATSGPPPDDPRQRFRCKVNQEDKAVELPLYRIGGSGKENPHMRGFWGSTISVFLGFFGWFALAPVTLDVMHSIGVCENQLYIVGKDLTRRAFVEYVNKDSTRAYCVHGKLPDSSDCNEIPDDFSVIPSCQEDPTSEPCSFAMTNKYDFTSLTMVKCLCDNGTECKKTVTRGMCASALSTVIARIAIGVALEIWGPVRVQSSLILSTGAFMAMSAAIESPWRFVMVRFLIGCSGATFITNQYWCSLMFAPNVVGTANATAAGWGNLGGGVAQIFIIWGLMIPFSSVFGVNEDIAWRLAMLVPAVVLIVFAVLGNVLCWDTPTQRRFSDKSTSPTSTPCADYVACLRNPNVWLMMAQYAGCFGTEVTMNNFLPMYFRVYFEMSAGTAALLAGSFGAMNLFARSVGGMLSDEAFGRFGFRGRLWAQFIALLLQGVFFYEFSLTTKNHEWYHLLGTLIPFSIFVNVGEGTSYGIVPFIDKEMLAAVTAIIGAAGSAGAVFAGFAFYAHDWEDPRAPMINHAQAVIMASVLTPLFYWPEYGSMFRAPAVANSSAMRESKSVQAPNATAGARALLASQLVAQHRELQPQSNSNGFDFLDMLKVDQEHTTISVAPPAITQSQDVEVRHHAIGASQ
jgi:NNP family nitrate/nitrite transporter-like MFS transporter